MIVKNQGKGKRNLLQRDKSRRMRSSDTGSTVLDRLVCNTELSQVVSNHLGLDFNLQDEKVDEIGLMRKGL